MIVKSFSLFVLVLFGCVNSIKSPCTKKYVNETFGVTLYHSEDWAPYEFFGNNIGLEYRGLNNFERRYDAEVVITFFQQGITKKDYFDIYIKSDTIQKIVESLGGLFEKKLTDYGMKEFAGKKWRVLGIEEELKIEGKINKSRELNYLWYSGRGPITIRTRVKGEDEIDNLDEDFECILSSLEFQGLMAYHPQSQLLVTAVRHVSGAHVERVINRGFAIPTSPLCNEDVSVPLRHAVVVCPTWSTRHQQGTK